MDRFEQTRVFVAVVEAGGFARATKRIGISRAAISKHVMQLEQRLGVRLLNRTTRHVSVTETGRSFYERCRRILAELEDAEHSASRADGNPAGELRVVAPMNFGRADLGPAITELLIAYPGLRIDLSLNDRVIDPIEAGYDIAIRVGAPGTSAALSACRISISDRILCAAPNYLARRGAPETPHDLVGHDCLSYSGVQEPHVWRLSREGTEHVVRVSGPIVTSAGQVLKTAALRGLGIAYGPANFFREHLDDGRLQRVLPQFCLPQVPIYSIYPASRYPSSKVAAFNDFMVRYLGQLHWPRRP